MKYVGDIAEDATIRGSFNTRDTAGAPITLAGSPSLAVYKDAGTTEITAGITLTVDFDSRTGHHVWTVDTSADAAYTPGSDYRVVITAGTVDGISVVGVEVGCFSIENRYSAGGGSGLDAAGVRAAIGLASANLDTQLATIDTTVSSRSSHSASDVWAVGTRTITGGTISTNSDKAGYSLTATTGLGNQTSNITGNLSGSVGSVSGAVGSVTAGVTLAASQPSYAPLLAASYTAPDNTGISAIKAKTDNLPSDPADQSVIIAATDAILTAVGTRLASADYTVPPSAATISTQVASDLATAHGAGSWATATGFSTHSAADVWAVGTRTITGGSLTTAPPTAAAIADAVWDEARTGHTTSGTFGFYLDAAISGVSGGGGGGGDATLAKQEEILDAIDTYFSQVLATVDGTADTIVGFPATLTIGNSYTTDGGNAIHVFIRDENDAPITSVGTHNFTDPDFSCDLIITNSGNAGRVRATVTYVDPGAAESYLKVEIPLSESSRAAAGAATMQCTLKWDGVAKTIATQTVTWVARI